MQSEFGQQANLPSNGNASPALMLGLATLERDSHAVATATLPSPAANQSLTPRDGWWWTISASIGLMRNARNIIESLQGVIKQQEERIALLQQQSTTDELTGLANRRGFFDAFLKETDRTNRGFSEGGLLIMVDLDNFKMINDTYGHQAGDAALRLVARALSSDIRVMDISARLGGDEFVLLLTNTTKDKALGRAQNFIKKMNSLSFVWYGAEIPVRASLGLKEYTKGCTAEQIFEDADIRMYDQKKLNKTDGDRARMALAAGF